MTSLESDRLARERARESAGVCIPPISAQVILRVVDHRGREQLFTSSLEPVRALQTIERAAAFLLQSAIEKLPHPSKLHVRD